MEESDEMNIELNIIIIIIIIIILEYGIFLQSTHIYLCDMFVFISFCWLANHIRASSCILNSRVVVL